MKKKKKIALITGAAGQDGIILSKILVRKKYKVFGIIKEKNYLNKVKKVKYIQVNILFEDKIKKILKKIQPDFLIHFGSENPSFVDKKNNSVFYKKNKKQTINLINSLINLKLKTTFIFANSSKIFYKKKGIIKVNEKNKFSKNSAYSKFRVEILNYMVSLKKRINFKFVNLILFNHDSKFRNKKFLFPRIIKSIKEDELNLINKIYKKNIFADFSHAEDICNAIYLLIKKGITIDNLILSSNRLTSVNKIINYILRKTKKKLITDKIISKKEKNLIGDNSLAKKILKWKINKNVYQAIDEIIGIT